MNAGTPILTFPRRGGRDLFRGFLNLMSQIDYEHETACEFSRGFLGGVD